jgi:hypothetical protein
MFLMGLRGYASNYKNLFDATITIVGLVCAHLRLARPRLHATTACSRGVSNVHVVLYASRLLRSSPSSTL